MKFDGMIRVFEGISHCEGTNRFADSVHHVRGLHLEPSMVRPIDLALSRFSCSCNWTGFLVHFVRNHSRHQYERHWNKDWIPDHIQIIMMNVDNVCSTPPMLLAKRLGFIAVQVIQLSLRVLLLPHPKKQN